MFTHGTKELIILTHGGMDLWLQEVMLVRKAMWPSRILHPIIENSSGGVPTRDYNVA